MIIKTAKLTSISLKHNQKLFQLLNIRLFSVSKSHLASPQRIEFSPDHYDIVISGGGLVGTTLACTLSKTRELVDRRILLLDAAPTFEGFFPKQYTNHISAINNASAELFKRIGVWEEMLKGRVKRVHEMQVWDASSDAVIEFQFKPFSDDAAYVMENELILHSLYKELQSTNIMNTEVRRESRIATVQLPRACGSPHSIIQMEDGETITCDLLIGVDGSNSIVRSEMGVDIYSINYESMGVVATIELAESTHGGNTIAWQRFIPNGSLTLLPLNDTMSSLVWITPVDHAKELITMSEAEFVAKLNEAFCKDYRKSGVINALCSINSFIGRNSHRKHPPRVNRVMEYSRACFPLGFLHASSYICDGAALLGDAAHRTHPLAGKGVNLGLSDISNLVKVLSCTARKGEMLGDSRYLMQYERMSMVKNVPIMLGVHGLHSLFSTSFSPVVLLRTLALQLTCNSPQIKNIFMQRTIG